MAWIETDWSKELSQVKGAVGEIVDEQVAPMVKEAIAQAGKELSLVVAQAGKQVEANIRVLSDEIHNQRRLTKEELTGLIDYASEKLASTLDERVARAKAEVSSLVTEKFVQLKGELEDAAVRSRKTLYLNLSLSLGAAMAMAAIGIVYKRISLDELDIFSFFRVMLLSLAVGTGLYAGLRAFSQWRALNRAKKNAATTVLNYMGVLRPNGAVGLLAVCGLFLAAWLGLTFYLR